MIDVNRYAAYYWLNRITRGNEFTQEDLKAKFGGAEGVWNAAVKDEIDYTSFISEKNLEKCDPKEIMKVSLWVMKKVSESGIGVVCRDDEDYPELLRETQVSPAILFFEGNIGKINRSKSRLAVVGSRKCTYYGRDMCSKLVTGLKGKDICIVRGMARGIDAAAHRAALDAGMFTVAVLASGTDVVYPEENRGLYNKIKEAGVIISEQIPGTQPLKNYFPARNRIIAGIAEATFVAEAGASSGAQITANCALNAGRDLLVMPHRIDSVEGAGCNDMIKDGAMCVTSHADILLALGFEPEERKNEPYLMPEALDQNQLKVLSFIRKNREADEDEIAFETGIKSQEIKRALSALEIFGFVKKDIGGKFCAK